MTASMLPVRNPRTGEIDYHIPETSERDVAALSQVLRQAQTDWFAFWAPRVALCLNRFADAVASELVPLAEALDLDTGRTTFAKFEAAKSIELIRMWAQKSGPILEAMSGSGASEQVPFVHFEHRLIPYQMVAVISPWNVPLLLAMIDSLAALSAGCAVLLKPSEVTPRFIEPLQRALNQVPELAAVLRIVTGGPETGKAMIERADAVCFTGSVRTGSSEPTGSGLFHPRVSGVGGKDPRSCCPMPISRSRHARSCAAPLE